MNMDLFSHQERSIKCRFNKLERNRIFHDAKLHVVATEDKKTGRRDVYSFLRHVTSSCFTSFWVWQHVQRTTFCKNQRAG